MTFALQHRVSLVVVLAAVAAVSGVFALARPQYHPRYESKMIDFSQVRYISPAVVRRAFTANGIRLNAGDGPAPGFQWLSNRPKPWDADALQVIVAPRKGKGSWGPKLEPYDVRFGNVMVTYGGHDEHLLQQIETAVSALR